MSDRVALRHATSEMIGFDAPAVIVSETASHGGARAEKSGGGVLL